MSVPRLLLSGGFLAGVVSWAVVALAPPAADAQPAKRQGITKRGDLKQDDALAAKLRTVLEENKLPALWGAIVEGNRVVAMAAVGVRKIDSPEAVGISDQVHIGSATKAMTATLIAILIEKKKLRWDTTIGEVFPDLKDKIHADYLPVTLTQLLAHEAGLSTNADWTPTPEKKTLREYRRAMLPAILKAAPASRPGTKFSYSNSGYVVAAAMAEQVTGKSWEDLMKTMVFNPLNMTSAGFGAPGSHGKVDQPWGHRLKGEKLVPLQIDNPPVMGPASGVHCSMADWSKFAMLHLAAARKKPRMLKNDSFVHLHEPADGFEYAGGWVIHGDDKVLTHDGTNTLWYCRIQIHPRDNVALLVAMNRGGDEAKAAAGAAIKVLNAYYLDYLRQR